MARDKTSGCWVNPAAMVSALVLGVVAAVGHDRVYAFFDGRTVGTNLEQQSITNAGTALAFLAKVLFTIAAGIAFAQQLFHSLRRKQESISHLDMLFGLTENVLPLFNAKLWFRHPTLLLIGLITWCIPLSAVFTPGTINVEPSIVYTQDLPLKPAQPQKSWIGSQRFASCQLDYTAMTSPGDGHVYVNALCSGPSSDLYSVAVSSVAQRSVLPIQPPNQNSSYDLTFDGPALSCSQLSSTELQALNNSIAQAQESQYLPGSRTILGGVNSVTNPDSLQVRYNAWSYTTDGFNNNGCHNITSPFWHNDTADAEINYSCNSKNNTNFFFLTSDLPERNTMAGITCQLRNATYNIAFSYENGVQNVSARSVTLRDRIISDNKVDYDLPDYNNIVYSTVFTTFNKIVLAAGLNDTSPSSATGGVMYYDGLVQTSVLRDFIEGHRPLIADDLRTTIETMFQNITISTMSSAALRLSEADAAEVNVDIWRTVNIYVYNPRDLYIAYGCAFGVSLLCVIWGLFVIHHHHRRNSYSLAFSTILRTTRSWEIEAVVDATARKGTDPNPDDLGKVQLRYEDGDDQSGTHGFRVFHAGQPEPARFSHEAQESSSMLQAQYGPISMPDSRGKYTASVSVGRVHDR
ncbi:hypothetical protein F5X99DRAFT_373190 [Biscogniauxia marginata]|nr:hypothetical protein F5X99DRAFT_373190 [Biscogniauxia marginata]